MILKFLQESNRPIGSDTVNVSREQMMAIVNEINQLKAAREQEREKEQKKEVRIKNHIISLLLTVRDAYCSQFGAH